MIRWRNSAGYDARAFGIPDAFSRQGRASIEAGDFSTGRRNA